MDTSKLLDDEIIQLGLDAERLLNDETYKRLYSMGGKMIAAQFLSLPLECSDEVAKLHNAKCAYDLFERTLRHFVTLKEELVLKRAIQDAHDDDL